jgi:signal transduction histidine kinase
MFIAENPHFSVIILFCIGGVCRKVYFGLGTLTAAYPYVRMLKFLLFFLAFVVYLIPSKAQEQERGAMRLQYNHRDTKAIVQDIKSASDLMAQGVPYASQSMQLFNSLLAESRSIGFHDGVIMSLTGLAGCYHNERQLEKAIDKLQEALAYARQAGNSNHDGKLEGNLGLVYYTSNDYTEAIEHFTRALEYYKDNSTDTGLSKGNVLMNIADVLSLMNRDSAAFFYIRQAEAEAKKKNSEQLLCWTYYKKALIYAQLDSPQWNESKTYLLKGLAIALKRNYQPAEIAILKLLSKVSTLSGEYDKALEYSKETLRLPLSGLDKADTYLGMGQQLNYLKKYDAALASLLQAKDFIQRNNVLFKMKANLYLELGKAYSATGRFKEATESYKLANAAKDSIIQKNLSKRIYGLEEKFEVAKRDKEIAQSQLLISQQQVALFRRNIWIISLLASTALSGVGLFLYLHNRQNIQRQLQRQSLEAATWQATLEGEEKERGRIARELHDNIGGSLGSLKMWFGSIRERHSNLEQEKEYDEALSLLDGTLDQVRRTAHSLMPELLLHEGLINAVRIFCDYMQKASGIKIDYQYFGYVGELDKNLELTLYRMIQELVQNVVKHAEASHILLQLSCHETLLSITVEDNGKGMNPAMIAEKDGLGLKSIQRTITNLRGHFDVQSEPGSGTTIDIDIDLLTEEAKVKS